MVMMTVTSLFITSLSTRARSTISSSLKSQGSSAMNQMQFMLRNAKPLTIEECDELDPVNVPESSRGSITFTSRDNNVTTFEALPNPGTERRIASNSAEFASPYYLIDETVDVNDTLVFGCEQGFDGQGQYISIDFVLTKEANNGSTTITQDFSSGVQIRNTTGSQ